ncbi:MBL fold metallo-hydrolase [Streptacidiphilus griseoplanus]|uniref:MBL fold metallo-hydrolase n=1 Tax=Peterkaempfera griseoplana TaxID=66896 RepID=UPI0006E1F784
MKLTKYGHACVRLEAEGTVVVIDPGAFSEPEALAGADAVLVTHDHFDHVAPDALRAAAADNPSLQVWTNASVAAQFADLGDRVHAVAHGDAFTVGAGIPVRVHGEKHAVIHSDIPVCDNVGFLVADRVFHPGDALTVPGEPVTTLLVPVSGPWLKLGEVVDFVRAVGPREGYLIHEALLSELGLNSTEQMLGRLAGGEGRSFSRLASGQTVVLG